MGEALGDGVDGGGDLGDLGADGGGDVGVLIVDDGEEIEGGELVDVLGGWVAGFEPTGKGPPSNSAGSGM